MGKLNLNLFSSSFLLMLIFNSTFVFANFRRPSGAVFLNPKAYSIEFSEYVFSTTAYFDYQGHENSMPNEYGFMLADTELKLGYGYSSNLQFEVMGRMRYLNSMVTPSANNTITKTKLGLESAQMGVKYQLPSVGNNFFALGLHYRQSMYTNHQYDPPQTAPNDDLVLGDDGAGYGVDFYSSYLFSKSRIDANLSLVKPGAELSQEIQYKLEGIYQFQSLGAILGVEGIMSLKKDPYSGDPNLKPKISTGATSLFNSINREKMAPYFGALYDFKKVTFEARGGMIMSGTSIDKGYFALMSINLNSEGVTSESVKIDSFKEYHIDGSVLKVSARGTYVKIDQGLSTDVEKGMQFDIYQTDYFGGNVLVASGIVYEVGSDWSVIKLSKKFSDIEIKPGFAARGK